MTHAKCSLKDAQGGTTEPQAYTSGIGHCTRWSGSLHVLGGTLNIQLTTTRLGDGYV